MQHDVQVSTPESAAFSLETAGLGSRFLALLIDKVIQAVIASLLYIAYFALFWPLYWEWQSRAAQEIMDVVMTVLLAVVLLLYHLIFEAVTRGRTPGKWIVGLRVVKTTGVPIGFWEACLRNLVRVVDYLPGMYFAGTITIFVSPQNRRLGDLAAGTIVVRDRREQRRPVAASAGGAAAPAAGSGAPSPAAAVPAAAAAVHRSSHMSLHYRDEELIAEYLIRRQNLTPDARTELARQLADRLHQAGISPADFGLQAYASDEDFLVAWHRARQRTE